MSSQTPISRMLLLGKQRGLYDQKKIEEAIISFNDPLAQKISWSYLETDRFDLPRKKLVEDRNGNIEYVKSLSDVLFSVLAFFISIFLLLLFFKGIRSIHDLGDITFTKVFIFIWIIFFLRGSIGYLFAGLGRKIFNFQLGYFNVGRGPNLNSVSLKNVKALQILHLTMKGSMVKPINDNSLHIYQINLILDRTKRVLVINHNNLLQALSDSKKIAAKLGVPIWDISLIPNIPPEIPFGVSSTIIEVTK